MKKFLPKSFNNPQGFTLVELLVVISIIAILSVIGTVVYSGVSARGRDAKRMAEINAIQQAMEKNYQPGATNTYPVLNTTDFVNGAVPLDPSTGTSKCGASALQICEYCAFAKDTTFANYATCTNKVSTTQPAAATGYVVCANLETKAGVGGNTYYCKSNAQ